LDTFHLLCETFLQALPEFFFFCYPWARKKTLCRFIN
jgi:hypothetical protein